jgi:hypothetical protein
MWKSVARRGGVPITPISMVHDAGAPLGIDICNMLQLCGMG